MDGERTVVIHTFAQFDVVPVHYFFNPTKEIINC